MSRCRSCRAPLLWVEMPSGRKNPLDPLPVTNGNIVLLGAGKAAVVDKDNIAPGTLLYVSHFSTCPNARQHRQPAARK